MSIIRQVSSTVLHTSSFCQIDHLPVCKTICYQLKGYLEEDDAREFLEKVLFYIQKTQSQNLIAELSDYKGTHMDLAKYLGQVWSHKLTRFGVKRIAINVPKSKFGAFSNKISTISQGQTDLTYKDFNNLDDALAWVCAKAGNV